jgi:sugar lactone lactonase YvrE
MLDLTTMQVKLKAIACLSGSTDFGIVNGDRTASRLHCPEGICMMSEGELLVADRMNNVVRRVDLVTGQVSTFAGCGDVDDSKLDSAAPVPAVNARLFAPSGICADPIHPGHAFISTDEHQRCIRQYSPADQTVRIVAGQASEEDPDSAALLSVQRSESGSSAVFSDIACLTSGVLAGSSEPLVYFTSMQQHVVRSYNPRTHEVRLVVGTGQRGSSSEGRLSDPYGLAIDSVGRLVIGCLEGYQIVRFDPLRGSLEVLAGQYEVSGLVDGDGTSVALLGDVTGLSIDEADNIYFCDFGHHRIRMISSQGLHFFGVACFLFCHSIVILSQVLCTLWSL